MKKNKVSVSKFVFLPSLALACFNFTAGDAVAQSGMPPHANPQAAIHQGAAVQQAEALEAQATAEPLDAQPLVEEPAVPTMPEEVLAQQPLPQGLRDEVYKPAPPARTITPADISGPAYTGNYGQTVVGQKVLQLHDGLVRIQNIAAAMARAHNSVGAESQGWAADYYANIATINTQLQTGTTRGNPRLISRLSDAEVKLERFADSLIRLNNLSVDISRLSSEATFLMDEIRAAYGISGAIEEDHMQLRQLEDTLHATLVVVERLLNETNDDITRISTYLSTERNNLRTLSLAVTNGDLYGKSLANRPFSMAPAYGDAQPIAASYSASAPASAYSSNAVPEVTAALSGPRPLAKIRFDRSDVNYEQPVYAAVSQALEKYPNARFDLVAVHPTNGNAAQVAVESTKARRNAEKVLRALTQMGLPMDQVDLSYDESAQATSSEVHLFVK